MTLQQREPGYLCSYQLSPSEGGWRGTWRDTNGASGTVVLIQARKPHPIELDLDL